MAITTAAEYARLGQPSQSTGDPDLSKVKLAYITISINQLKTQLMLLQQHPLY